MMRLVYVLGVILFVFCGEGLAEVSPNEAWQFEQLRKWASHPDGPGDRWDGDTATGVAGHPEIAQTDPLYKKLTNLFRRKSGLAMEDPALPPYGKLVWWDIDEDGVKDIVFAGGASPDPYFVILKETGDTWRVWQECRGRLLSIVFKNDSVILIAAVDGYGVSRDSGLDIKICNPREQGTSLERSFRWAGELSGLATQGSAAPCTTVRDTGLRMSPKVDNTPEESGMGFDWPGNLYQKLAKGSSGWLLGKTVNRKGEPWSLGVFPDPVATADAENPLQAMTTPKQVRRPSSPDDSSKIAFIVGWIKTRDLNGK